VEIVKRLCVVAGQPDLISGVTNYVDPDSGSWRLKYTIDGSDREKPGVAEKIGEWWDLFSSGRMRTMIIPEQRLSVIAQAAQRLRELAANGRSPDRLEALQLGQAIELIASANADFIEVNQKHIEEMLGMKLPEDLREQDILGS
jgi:hypothetical protein